MSMRGSNSVEWTRLSQHAAHPARKARSRQFISAGQFIEGIAPSPKIPPLVDPDEDEEEGEGERVEGDGEDDDPDTQNMDVIEFAFRMDVVEDVDEIRAPTPPSSDAIMEDLHMLFFDQGDTLWEAPPTRSHAKREMSTDGPHSTETPMGTTTVIENSREFPGQALISAQQPARTSRKRSAESADLPLYETSSVKRNKPFPEQTLTPVVRKRQAESARPHESLAKRARLDVSADQTSTLSATTTTDPRPKRTRELSEKGKYTLMMQVKAEKDGRRRRRKHT